jgi:AraC family transcriptional activator of mtrCDE
MEIHMSNPVLDTLLLTLDVAVDAFAICEVKRGYRLIGRPKNTIEIHYVLAGTMHLHTPARDVVVCGPGSLALIPPMMPQSIAADASPGRDVLAVDCCSIVREGILLFDAAQGGAGDLRVVCGAVTASGSGSYGLFDGIGAPIVEEMGDLQVVRSAYAALLSELERPGLGSRALSGSLMKTCLMMMIRRHFERTGATPLSLHGLGDPRLAKAVATVMNRPAEPYTIATLATAVGMSRSTFAREFSRAFQQTPLEFVTRTRLYHAARMLKSTSVPVKVVAASAGFSSRSHFSRVFHQIYGTDPSTFRKSGSREPTLGPRPDRKLGRNAPIVSPRVGASDDILPPA